MTRRRERLRRQLSAAARGVAFMALFLALQRLSLVWSGAAGVSLWYLPAGLTLAFLTRFGARNAPWVYAATALAGAVQSPMPVNHAAAVIGTLAYALGALLLRRAARWETGTPTVRDAAGLALAALLAPAGAAVGTVLYLHWSGTLTGAAWLPVAFHWWVGDAVGVMALTPPLLLLRRRPALRAHPAVGAAFALIPLTALLALGAARQLNVHLEFLCFVPVLWIAIRAGLPAAAWGALVMNAGVTALTWSAAPAPERLEGQLLMATLSLTALLVGAGASERRRDRDRLAHLALTDVLTGLPNRHAFMAALQQLRPGAAQAPAPGGGLLVMVLDISRLKWVNDTLGHALGDHYVRAFSRRLTQALPPGAAAARLSGGTFALACPQDRPDPGVVAAALRAPMQVGGRELTVAFRTGAVFAASDVPTGVLLQQAEDALENARRTGQDVLVPSLSPSPQYTALQYEHDLQRALRRPGELELYYQPQVDLRTLQVTSFEALIRWNHPERGLVAPAAFLPVAERTGLIVPISTWVLQEACRQLRLWTRWPGQETLRMAVNIAPGYLHAGTLLADVTGALDAHGLVGSQLELELTESSLLLDPAAAAEILAQVQAGGVGLALDDFGTGYSSIRHLKDFQVSTLKIDRSFIRHLLTSDADRRIVRGLTALGRIMGTAVLAEGAEDQATVLALRDLGCHSVQGYALGRPLPARDAGQVLMGRPVRGPGERAP
ncbi:EAL domain-containing protein (plasmid) [Deinococcus taeanensis]|uniref:putative bifunctional diguanylate cyclase/phosphodiesterase n=1 Tax=Deinococcus taeanensis TaxID=2737050 RepID=UPI001CDCC864|nr:EAL domain-containing protein [Deinococcus taeanensis]UBV44405.1 EAL domain-containing protein [Deinococcus taeanensis]